MGGTSSKQTKSNEELKSFIENEVKQHKVVIWSKSYCGYCARTKALFQSSEFQNIDVKVHELDRIQNGRAIQSILGSMTGQTTVPSVWVGGKFIGGNSETQAAYENGKLRSML